MEWEFTPAEVVQGKVDYGLENFRADMLQEVKLNMSNMESVAPEQVFNIMYELCYWVATGNDYDEFLSGLDQDSFFPAFLASIKSHLSVNIEMLGAILQRQIMELVEGQSIPLEDAIKQVDEMHRGIVARPVLN
jgi:hypothetical protein